MSNNHEKYISESDYSLKRHLDIDQDSSSEKSMISQHASELLSTPNIFHDVETNQHDDHLSELELPYKRSLDEDVLSYNRFYLNESYKTKKITTIPAASQTQSFSIRPSNRHKLKKFIKSLYNIGQESSDEKIQNTTNSESKSMRNEISNIATIQKFSGQFTKSFPVPNTVHTTSNNLTQVQKLFDLEPKSKLKLSNFEGSHGLNYSYYNYDRPYCQKYAPRDIFELYSNRSQALRLQSWLRPYSCDKNQTFFINNKNKIALISGPPGVGKTTVARIIPQSLGLRVIEFNASDCRNKTFIQEKILPYVRNTSIINSDKVEKSVLIMDDVDIMSECDEGGIAAFIECIKITKIPIICICNDSYSSGIKRLKKYCLEIKFVKANVRDTLRLVNYINESENLKLKSIEMEMISMYSKGDIRFCLNILEFSKYNFVLTSQKDCLVEMNSFETLHFLLSQTKSMSISLEEKVSMVLRDYEFLILLLTEYYLETICMEDMADASNALAFADIIMNKIKQEQEQEPNFLVEYANMCLLCMTFSTRNDIILFFERNPVKSKKNSSHTGKQTHFNTKFEEENDLSILMSELSKIV